MNDQEDQYFKFKKQDKAILFVDGNYMINISRSLSLKIDMEKLFDHLSKEFFRYRTYWYSALEGSIDRTNNAYRFLDRLRYIPRTKVYAGRYTKKHTGHYETALRTDAGTALAVNMTAQAIQGRAEYFLLIAADPEYIPAIRSVQRHGGIVRLITPEHFGELRPHSELIKAVDEVFVMDTDFLNEFEYVSTSEIYQEPIVEPIIEEEEDLEIPIENGDPSEDDLELNTLEAQIGDINENDD